MNGGISGPCKISVSSRSNATSYNVDVDIETTNYISQTLRVIALDGYYV